MATVAELGQRVKAKYPGAYDDLPDVEVGRKVKTKHPGAYDDFTDSPPLPASAGKVDPASIAEMIPKDAGEWGLAAKSFLTGLVVDTGKGLLSAAYRAAAGPKTKGELAASLFLGPTAPLIMDMARSHVETAGKGIQAAKEGRYSEAAGYAGAAALPVVGPMAASIGETIGGGEIARGAGQTAAVFGGPAAGRVASKVAEMAPRAARAAGRAVGATASSAGARDVIGVFSPRAGRALDLIDKVRDAMRRSEGLPEEVPPTPAPPAPVATEPIPAPVATIPESVPRATAPKRAPRKAKPKETQEQPPAPMQAEDLGQPITETAAEAEASYRAQNRSFWDQSAKRDNPLASRSFAPSEAKPPTAKPTVESLSREMAEAGGFEMNPPLKKPTYQAKTFEDSARSAKTTALAQALHDAGISQADAKLMTKEHWQQAAQAAKVKPPSLASVERTLFEMGALERKVVKTAPAAPTPSISLGSGTDEIALASTEVPRLQKAGLLDDSGGRTLEMAIRRTSLSASEAEQIAREAARRAGGVATGKHIAEVFQELDRATLEANSLSRIDELGNMAKRDNERWAAGARDLSEELKRRAKGKKR